MSGQKPVAIVTGGARRLGAEICLALAREGYQVAVHHNSSELEASALVERIEKENGSGQAAAFMADITDADSRATLVDQVATRFGRLDLLVNNASKYTKTPPDEMTMEDLTVYHKIHVEAPTHLALLTRKLLAQGTPGRIINILDIFADFPRKGFLPYCASKAGLKAITKQLALELAPDILVNGVAPGAILPPEGGLEGAAMARIMDRIPLGRFGQAGDISQAVVFLASSRYITGQVITVDGGRSINI
ncbi:MAG: SDR family oxidoreductase [Nitrospinota bacterium]|nr:SDR family oxidoreductase [Nitrospinota bacterium]